ncbi:MAG: GTP cyclohydrolase I FolE [Spirochaetes bacterium]|nr:GTP cyclohydrolase I FolE [Spirochaetota bacterium]
MQELIKKIISMLGDDVSREGLKKTPFRVEKSLKFLTSGNRQNLKEIINGAIFDSENNEMVIVKDIEFFSLCEHHMLPFFGKCHIGYIPDKKILGLSKFARITNHFSRRLQIQERLTSLIAESIDDVLKPLGVAVVIEGMHLCMMMRGVQKQNSYSVTSALRGMFKKDPRTRNEFLMLIGKSCK